MYRSRDWKTFCTLMNAAAEVSATQPKSNAALGLMFALLSKYSIQDIQRAVQIHLQSADGKFCPTPAHIINILEGEPEDRAEVAWQEFRRAVEKYGPYESVRFPKPAFHYAIKMLGGWLRINKDLSDMTEKEIKFYGKDFKRLYAVGEKRATWENVPLYFPGEFERNNRLINSFKRFAPWIYMVDTGVQVSPSKLLLPAGKEIESPERDIVSALADKFRQNGCETDDQF